MPKYLLKSSYDKNERNKNFKCDPLNKNIPIIIEITKTTLQHWVFIKNERAQEQRISQCVLCSESHKPSNCVKVTTLDSGIEILKQQK